MRRSFLHKIDPHADPEDALYVLYARLPDLSDDQVTALIPKSLRKEGMKWNRDGMRLHSDNITLNLIEGRLYVDGVSKVPLKYLISQKSSLLATEREKTYSYESADQAYQIAKETGFLYQRRYDEWYQVVTPSGKHLPFQRIKDQPFLIHPETRAFFHGPYRGQLNGDRIESIEVIEDGHAYPLAPPPPLFAAIEEKQWIHCYCEGTQIVKVDYPRLNLSYKWDDKKQRFYCQHPDLDGFYLTATTLSKQLNIPQSHEPEQHYQIVMNHEGVARLLLPKVPYAPAYLKGETPINTRHRPPRMRPQWQGHPPSLGIFNLDDRASLPFKL
ncbi:MAG: hypothetical protein KDK65_03550 [Chlamydiia bacterium]|nr:hypothetical protein [Chlamydiia bacterium]